MGQMGREVENLGDGPYLLLIPYSPRPVAYNLLELPACHGFLAGSNNREGSHPGPCVSRLLKWREGVPLVCLSV